MVERADDEQLTAWALAAGRGDREALVAFIRGTQRDVHRLVAHLGDPGTAEDLTQETFLRAFRALGGFSAQAPARTWLLSIARRVAADAVRQARRRPRTTPVATTEGLGPAGRTHGPADDHVLLRQLVEGLPADRREAFVLTQVLGLSYAEAAEVCDCPVGTIRSRVARARQDLTAALDAGARRREA
ncbi:RNA polymerase subunit sigma [Pseudonocardia sp. CNS-139]|nr:RNA polymerase subunit sigma [Pseudonocardia sp. CNS-139]